MDKMSIEIVMAVIIDNLAAACGGRSQYTWATLGNAIRGHMAQGSLQGADLRVVLDVALELEMAYWECQMAPIQVAMIKSSIREGIEKK
jgi:hypothetical protein